MFKVRRELEFWKNVVVLAPVRGYTHKEVWTHTKEGWYWSRRRCARAREGGDRLQNWLESALPPRECCPKGVVG